MRIKQTIKKLTILMLSGVLILGCKKTTDQSKEVEAVSTTKKKLNGSRGGCVDCGAKENARSMVQITEANDAIHRFNTFYNTDYLSVGVGGLRDVGNGQIRVTGTFLLGSVTKAYLFWNGLTHVASEVGKSIKFANNSITGTNIGISESNCWSDYENTQSYRADVTSIVKSSASRTFTISDFGVQMNPNGASLILFYSDGNSSNNRDIILFEGNDSLSGFAGYPGNANAPNDSSGWNLLLSGIKYTSGKVMMSLQVADGQNYADGPIFINGKYLSLSAHIFDGKSVPGGLYWDIQPIDITPALSKGMTSINMTSKENSDCYSLVVAVFNFPRGIVLPPSIN